MKFKKFLFIFVIAFTIFIAGCSSKASPEKLWNNYIKAMNEKNIEKVAEIYYAKDSTKYVEFLEVNDEELYFDFNSLVSKKFTPMIVNDRYYSAEVLLSIDGSDNIIDLYFVKDVASPWRFISEVDVLSLNASDLGNKPNANYYNSIIKDDGTFQYKYIYSGLAGVEGPNDYAKIVHTNKKQRKVVIPGEIEGVPVAVIGDFAFFDFFRLFSLTFSTSKLEEITLPEGLKIIDHHAFYQTKKLKAIVLPSTLQEVKAYAFASSGLRTLTINVDDELAYEQLAYKNGQDALTIQGNRVGYAGDSVAYTVVGYAPNAVQWSTDNEEVAAFKPNSNTLEFHTAGTVTIKAKYDEELFSTAELEVLPAEEKRVDSTLPSQPLFATYKFSVNKYFYTTEEVTINMPLDTIWSTSDSKVAIAEGGKIKMVGAGTVTIKATASANPELFVSATIHVKDISEKLVVSVYSFDNFTFTGARDMFTGDYIKAVAAGFTESEIEWSSSNEAIATVGRHSGLITARGTGTVTIRARMVSNPNIVSQVSIQVKEPIKGVSFAENSLDRLNNLKEIYIYAINPNSIEFKGVLKLNSDVKIYVPAQNIETYKTVFSDYAKNFIAMAEE